MSKFPWDFEGQLFVVTAHDDQAPVFAPTKHRFLSFKREIGEEKGTPHYHILLQTKYACKASTALASMGYKPNKPMKKHPEKRGPAKMTYNCYITKPKDTDAYAAYIQKPETSAGEYTQLGVFNGESKSADPSGKGKKRKWEEVAERVQAGHSLDQLEAWDPAFFHQNLVKLKQSVGRQAKKSKKDWETKVVIFIGTGGTGKTHAAQEYLKNLGVPYYPKTGKTTEWNDYEGQEHVLWNDFKPEEMSYQHFFQMFDRERCSVRGLYQDMAWRCKLLVITVTEDRHPSNWWPEIEDRTQIQRRIDRIYTEEMYKRRWPLPAKQDKTFNRMDKVRADMEVWEMIKNDKLVDMIMDYVQ